MKNFLRIFTLMKSLKLPFTENITDVFYSCCGITLSALSIQGISFEGSNFYRKENDLRKSRFSIKIGI
ncbi:unnamed protein product [Blepharisma stoltei]|uniref:Uncharacterized protein n=1 Tax=Blepharisma stoltei TaxID=1481888 RepID=A0AAU9JR92_9CILI|nr:unnamed protein product [Blepharisma stoltei]